MESGYTQTQTNTHKHNTEQQQTSHITQHQHQHQHEHQQHLINKQPHEPDRQDRARPLGLESLARLLTGGVMCAAVLLFTLKQCNVVLSSGSTVAIISVTRSRTARKPDTRKGNEHTHTHTMTKQNKTTQHNTTTPQSNTTEHERTHTQTHHPQTHPQSTIHSRHTHLEQSIEQTNDIMENPDYHPSIQPSDSSEHWTRMRIFGLEGARGGEEMCVVCMVCMVCVCVSALFVACCGIVWCCYLQRQFEPSWLESQIIGRGDIKNKTKINMNLSRHISTCHDMSCHDMFMAQMSMHASAEPNLTP